MYFTYVLMLLKYPTGLQAGFTFKKEFSLYQKFSKENDTYSHVSIFSFQNVTLFGAHTVF